MKRIGLSCLLLVILLGCTTPQVSMPVGVASVMYAQARSDYATAKVLVSQACKSGKWDAEACEAAKQIDVRAQVYRQAIESSMMHPQQPIDWVQILQFSEAVAGLILRLGLMP